jgi:threonyl-tRNA synthetase
MDNSDHLYKLRHSASHLLASAVKNLYPESLATIGPATENGFYYDFDNLTVSPEDLQGIEQEMKKIVKDWSSFEQEVVSANKAKEMFADNKYKIELIEELEKKSETITIYKSGNFVDLCKGGHIDNPKESLKHFKLMSIAGAYWRGDEKNKMLTRIYGTAFDSEAELEKYLTDLELAKERDHRKIGSELGLFVFSEIVGKGLPLWTEKGAAIRREIERFIVDEEIKRGYLHVYTPDIAQVALYEKSGHYPYYKDSMYAPIKIDDEQYMLRPMTCPHHFELYLSKPHSYKELPVRIAELAKLYRYEQSGELTGLIRVRSFCLADAHIVAMEDQAESEIAGALELISYIAGIFGLKPGEHYRYRLSLGDRKDESKYYKDDESWEKAENTLRSVLNSQHVPFFEAEGEAAFYGPKIDVQMKNVNGKEDTAFTVQYDFVMPGRFKLEYIDQDGTKKQPIVIHRSSVGAIERVVAFLIEHFGGNFPFWISPTQVKVLPVSDKTLSYAEEIYSNLKELGFRVELDSRQETLGAKIRDGEKEKAPFLLIVGPKEAESGMVSVRTRGVGNGPTISISDFIAAISKLRAEKSLTLAI